MNAIWPSSKLETARLQRYDFIINNTYTSKKMDMFIGLWARPSKKRELLIDAQKKTPMNIDSRWTKKVV
jgi:hypothetical protein